MTESAEISRIVKNHIMAPSGEKADAFRTSVQKAPMLVSKKMLSLMAHVSIYYPESAGTYTSLEFIGTFVKGVSANHPELLVEEVEHAIHTGMMKYKFHTAPRLNDLFDMIREYVVEKRLEWVEAAKHNEKLMHAAPYHEKVTDAMKEAIKEATEKREREKLESAERERKEIEERNLKNAADQRSILEIYEDLFNACDHNIVTNQNRKTEYCSLGCDGFRSHKIGTLIRLKKRK